MAGDAAADQVRHVRRALLVGEHQVGAGHFAEHLVVAGRFVDREQVASGVEPANMLGARRMSGNSDAV
jgi:hypothetical protein